MEILRSTNGQRFAQFDDAPDLLCPVDDEWERELLAEGFSAQNAEAMAVQAPFRVTYGFGAFEDFATLEAALAETLRLTDEWEVYGGLRGTGRTPKGEPIRYDICGPDLLRRGEDGEFERIAAPCQDEFYSEPIREAVAA